MQQSFYFFLYSKSIMLTCRTERDAFSGAFFCTRYLFKNVTFTDSSKIEPGSGFQIFRASKYAFKFRNYSSFFVEHLSGLEYHMKKIKNYNLSYIKHRVTTINKYDNINTINNSVAIVPFWDDTHHSIVDKTTRLNYLRRTVESTNLYFQKTFVGCCVDFGHCTRLKEFVYIEIKCGKGTYLHTRLLRYFQSTSWDYYYFTEADQILHVNSNINKYVNNSSYIAPQRFEEIYKNSGLYRGPKIDMNNKSFVVIKSCFQ